MMPYRVLSVFGTRPEAIKMCPLIKEMQQCKEIESVVCITAQHREMLDQVLSVFQIKPDFDLDIMKDHQTLFGITSKIITGMEGVLAACKPDMVLVHGDTTTSFAAALAAFYFKIPVGHVEAGLRSFDKYSPFPEEMNRCLTGKIADLHFCPTSRNSSNLTSEGIDKNIVITGNTVIDSFKTTVIPNYSFANDALRCMDLTDRKILLITAHRRENLGQPLVNICRAIKRIISEFPDITAIYPVHMNPLVHETVYAELCGIDRIKLIEPINVLDMHNLLSRSFLVMTDSGEIGRAHV
jgi:UDP-N-acetylglucosamine 2-epimerase (non-hydrolysing)